MSKVKRMLKKKIKKKLKTLRYYSGEFVKIGGNIPISFDNGISYTNCQLTCEL